MADELWVGFWGIDREGMPYASVEKFNPKKHDKRQCEIRKELFPNPKEAIDAVLIGLTAEKAHMVATFDELMFNLVARRAFFRLHHARALRIRIAPRQSSPVSRS